jgi:hypothetical protein
MLHQVLEDFLTDDVSIRMLTYADVCYTYADVCWATPGAGGLPNGRRAVQLTYADVCYTYADVCCRCWKTS